jgi:hypothetical protein
MAEHRAWPRPIPCFPVRCPAHATTRDVVQRHDLLGQRERVPEVGRGDECAESDPNGD